MPKIMCQGCGSPDCTGCNIYTLERALSGGKLKWMMNDRGLVDVPETPIKFYFEEVESDA